MRSRAREISAALSAHSSSELAVLMEMVQVNGVGVGGVSGVLDLDGSPVFVKQIPLTDLELAHPGSTVNLFDLPMFCQYGIGSPGFNAWRELAANTMITAAVLAGETKSFPVLYHWRVLPGRLPVSPEHSDIDAVVAAFGDSAAVRIRMQALAGASSSLVLFCEYIPHSISDWLAADPVGKAASFEGQLAEIVTFLHGRELLHMDAHFGTIRTDGERIFLTDFGLATSPRFELSTAERDFVARHSNHDAGYAAMRLVNWLVTEVCGVAMPTTSGPAERNEYVSRCAAGQIPDNLPPSVARILTRHSPAAAAMNAFYWRLFNGEVDAEYPLFGEKIARSQPISWMTSPSAQPAD